MSPESHETQTGRQLEPGQETHSSEQCVDYLERIVYFLDNELDEADCVVVQTHLRECGPCLERFDLQRTVKEIVARSCHETAPDDLRDKVRLRLRQVQVEITER